LPKTSRSTQTEKHSLLSTGSPLPPHLAAGFPTQGLFAISRHPNYLAEQLLWVVAYLFSVSSTGIWLNPTITGPVLLILLFQVNLYTPIIPPN